MFRLIHSAFQSAPSEKKRDQRSGDPSWRQIRSLALLVSSTALISLTVTSERVGVARAADPEDFSGGADVGLNRSSSQRISAGSDPGLALLRDQPNTTSGRIGELRGGAIADRESLEKVDVRVGRDGRPRLAAVPGFGSSLGKRAVALTRSNNFVFFSIRPDLQHFAQDLVSKAPSPHVAVVVMNVKTGAVLAMADKSPEISSLALHAGFPAASLFKVVTAAAAVEQGQVEPDTQIAFRGGTYTLEAWNYLPDPRRDRRFMTVAEALGRSCNPVFGHIGLRLLGGQVLQKYAHAFGFNVPLGFELPLVDSRARIPSNDDLSLSRAAAGFGDVSISPVHAAALMAGIANGGLLPRPTLVDKVVSNDGEVLYKNVPEVVQRVVRPSTARTLLSMMEYTTTVGTSRREFMGRDDQPILGDVRVAGKTGTLSGSNPAGLNSWFIGAAPIHDPEVAVAVISVDPRRQARASHLAKFMFQRYFGHETTYEPSYEPLVRRSKYARSNKRSAVSYSKKKSKVRSIVPVKKKGRSPAVKSAKSKHSAKGKVAKRR